MRAADPWVVRADVNEDQTAVDDLLERAALGVTVEYIDEVGGRVRAPLALSSQVRFEGSSPIGGPRTFRGQRNFDGLWWMAMTRSHVGFESWLRRDQLIQLDFDTSVVGVFAWPFALHWHTDAGERHHSPDYFVRLANGAAVVLDVRTTDVPELDDECAVIASACAQVGWQHRRVGRSDPVFMANLRWLAGYRHPRCADARRTVALREAFALPRGLGDGAAAVGDPIAVRPTLFHLLWCGVCARTCTPVSLARTRWSAHRTGHSDGAAASRHLGR